MKRDFVFIFILFFFLIKIAVCQEVLIGKPLANHNTVNFNLSINTTRKPFVEYIKKADSVIFYFDGNDKPDLIVKSSYYSKVYTGNKSEKIEIIPFNGTELAYVPVVNAKYQKAKKFEYGENVRSHNYWLSNPKNATKKSAVVYFLSVTNNQVNKNISLLDTTDNFYVAFKIPMIYDTIFGWMKLVNKFPGRVTEYSFSCVHDYFPPVNIEFLSPKTICSNNLLLLSSNPSEGAFNGRGIKGRIFHPSEAVNGQQTIVYTACNSRGCPNTMSVNILVNEAPKVSVTTKNINNDSIILVGTPSGGKFLGEGLSENSPVISKKTKYNVKYEFTDSLGCYSWAWINNMGIPVSSAGNDLSDTDYGFAGSTQLDLGDLNGFNSGDGAFLVVLFAFLIIPILIFKSIERSQKKRKNN